MALNRAGGSSLLSPRPTPGLPAAGQPYTQHTITNTMPRRPTPSAFLPLARILAATGLAVLTLLLAACGSSKNDYVPLGANQSTAYYGDAAAAPRSAAAPSPSAGTMASTEMPGLGTRAGEIKKSKVQVAPFVRERAKDPLEVMALYYNSEDGLEAMLRTPKLPRDKARFHSPRGFLEYGLSTRRGKPLPGFEASGRRFVQGESGERYALYVRNMTTSRVEVVMSVDGLDVIDRGPASFEKRGYILDPGEKQLIQGFRYSNSEIQAFRFGTVPSSLAAQSYGAAGAANAGVVGFALFPESRTQPNGYTGGDVQRREMANPFPQSF